MYRLEYCLGTKIGAAGFPRGQLLEPLPRGVIHKVVERI